MNDRPRVLALSGGIGGAKLALGLYHVLGEDELAVVCNTGDDFRHLGFHISPDIDTVIYTLAGVVNRETGWGLADESWHFMEGLTRLKEETWFKLGDRDLATHVFRSERLSAGATLTEICDQLAARFGVRAQILPATNDRLRTLVHTDTGSLDFQHYFVRDRCGPRVTGFGFDGAERAELNPRIESLLQAPTLGAIVVCPSNPFISIDPMLAIPGLVAALKASPAPVIAVSPIIAGEAVKGPTAKMMRELGIDVSWRSIAEHYREFVDYFVVDSRDQHNVTDTVAVNEMTIVHADTLMTTDGDKLRLAREVLGIAGFGF